MRCGILSPGTGLDHQVGRLPGFPGDLAEDRLIPAEGGITEEELDEERFGCTCLSIVSGERMPPPVIAFPGLGPEELAGIDLLSAKVSPCLPL